MPTINEIIKWYFKPVELKYPAKHLFTKDTKLSFKESLISLEKLIERLPDGNKLPDKNRILKVYNLFYSKQKNPKLLFSKRDVRLLIWTLDFQPEHGKEIILFSDSFYDAIDIIKNNWKDSFIISLWHILMKNWSKLLSSRKNLKFFFKFLEKRSMEYSKNRKDIKKISSNIGLFLTLDSPENYAKKLLAKKIKLDNAQKLLLQKEYILKYDYFSLVAKEYIKKLNKKNINSNLIVNIYNFLKIHNSKKTTLLICSKIINRNLFREKIDIIKDETVAIIGDPIKRYKWSNDELTEKEQEEVEKARRKLIIILNKHFINIFFEKLVRDERRKNYWLRFINNIDDIKFCGNIANYRYLKSLKTISQYVDYRYKITSRNQSTCALIIYSKNFVFVEFTDTGALYIYKKENFNVDLNTISSITELKIWPTSRYACRNSEDSRYFYLNNEGRITHQGYWEYRINAWMGRYYYD